MSKFKPQQSKLNGSVDQILNENARLKKELQDYKIISRAIYELVNISSLQEWIDSFSYGEGVETISVLKTLVECNQDVSGEWNYYDWCEWVKSFQPEGLEL